MRITSVLDVGLFLSTNQGAWSRQVFRLYDFFDLLATQQAFIFDQIQDVGTCL
jgi:hypothetical protein